MPTSQYIINESTLTGLADAVRAKTGSSSAFTPAQLISEIENIPTGEFPMVAPWAHQMDTTLTEISSSETSAQMLFERAYYGCDHCK